ncbi:aromatic ring-hydroxylating dioxygenase subunit alpha [Ruegeria sp. R14_0]|uniref:aromatic ring-hydroxylating oxygenase subunit alpha n=1 Tax=Ruegeria sp. R14_0 TaxID=2821100 RepID=UPI001ADB8F68|nr:aromatic ring-hydroxylating dioxygenase subunit alpha [Ruegeria sp. R14_0]MBO9446928.1 aromatic ring-hydroxylating dioxygenase subunit alpha [Ruegeria sp. R14_0]
MNGAVPKETNLDRMRRILGEEGYAQLFRSIDQAAGLPNQAYWSEEWFQMEQELIFRRSWVFAGARAEIAEPGAMKPIEIAGTPIVLVHGRDGVIRGFQNVCRHRGMQLVTEPCKKATLTCPYHRWAYGLDGKLRARPHFDGPNEAGIFKDGGGDKLNLIPVRIEEFFGCLFVNISGTAEPLDVWMKPVLDQLRGYDLSAIRWAGKRDFEVEANWKLVYENYMEGYHVFALHPRLLEFAPMDVRWSGEWRRSTFVNGYRFPKLEEGRGMGLPHYPALSEEDSMKGQWFLTMPHFAVEIYPDQFTVLVAYPEAPDHCREELHVFVIGDEAATGERYEKERTDLINMWDDLNKEDISVLKGLQQGRRCSGYDGGRLSPHWEGPTLSYSQKIIELMADGDDLPA